MTRFVFWIAFGFAVLAQPQTLACSWWGDAEAVALREAAAAAMTADPAFVAQAQVSGGGFGVAVLDARRAVPYRTATGGREAETMADLIDLGFRFIVDLTPSANQAAAHRMKTGGRIGYAHFGFGTGRTVPEVKAIREFSALVGHESQLPLIISSPAPTTMGALWALHLMSNGVPARAAVEAARTVGLDSAGEADLWWQLRNGLLKDSGLAVIAE